MEKDTVTERVIVILSGYFNLFTGVFKKERNCFEK